LIGYVDGLETLVAALQGILENIRDTSGVKKITDALPSGSNDLGSIRLRDIAGNGINSVLNNSIRRLEARSSLTSANGSLDVGVVTDNSINRLESRSSVVGQVAGAGAEVKVTVIQDTETASHKRLQTETRIAPGSTINIGTGVPSDPSDLVVTRLLNEGSANMLVNGSLDTPIDFTYAPTAGQLISLQQLRIVFVANSFDYGEDDFGPNNNLTNGILVEVQVSSMLTTLVTIKNNEDFLMIPGEIPVIHDGVNDLIMANLSFGGAVKLDGNAGDFIRMRIRDNLTSYSELIAASNANGWTKYYKDTGIGRRDVYVGTREVVLRSQVGPAEWSDWSTNYESTAVAVTSFDDAVAKIFRFDLGYKDQQKDSDGFIQVVQQPTPGTERYFYSPDFCDKCTWWEDSVAVESLQLSTITDGQVYEATGHPFGIDIHHGGVRKGKQVVFLFAESYPFLVPVVEKSTNGGSTWSLVEGEDENYVVDYEHSNGVRVTFNPVLASGTLVRMSFRKAQTYLCTIKPATNKRLKLVYIEVQGVKGFKWTDTILLEFYMWISGVLTLVGVDDFNGMQDVAAECTGSYAVLPAMGGTDEQYKLGRKARGFSDDLLQLPFRYISYQDIRADGIAEIRIKLQNNIPFIGEYFTLTPHCQEVDL
jgi:hypothetical protein